MFARFSCDDCFSDEKLKNHFQTKKKEEKYYLSPTSGILLFGSNEKEPNEISLT